MRSSYDFEWNDLGHLSTGRPNLGTTTSVAVYRLMQFTLKDVALKELGPEKTAELFRMAGALAGRELCRNILDTSLPFAEFIADLDKKLVELKIGVLRFEKADLDRMEFILTLSEDLNCSGLPIYGETVCDYDEGFVAGIFKEYSGQDFVATEVDCWATGDRTCRFEVKKAGH